MALGGGSFISQNKVLPGSYINFVSVAAASATLSDRGIVTMPLELDWGIEGEVFTVTQEEFQKNSMKYFGYAYSDEKMKGLRDLFLNATTLHAYRLNSTGVKASNKYASAKYSGVRGNDIKTVIKANVETPTKFDVYTWLGGTLVDVQQGVSEPGDLVANDYVTWETTEEELEVTAGIPLTGGTNGTVAGTAHQDYLDAIEGYRYNVMGVVTTEATVKSLYTAFEKRMRDEVGMKFQLVLHNYTTADYLGVISVKNEVTDTGWPAASLVYWVTGAEAGCAVNRTLQNRRYDGEFTVSAAYTQTALENAIKAGEFVFHKVNDDIRVLDDINTMVTTTDTQGDIFKYNQCVRVIDQIGNDAAVLFSESYLGTVPNDEDGRTSLWSDIVRLLQALADIRAIEDFDPDDVTVEEGDSRNSVSVSIAITYIGAMSKLYMTAVVA